MKARELRAIALSLEAIRHEIRAGQWTDDAHIQEERQQAAECSGRVMALVEIAEREEADEKSAAIHRGRPR